MSDIQEYGAGPGHEFRWIRIDDQWHSFTQLVAIDEFGNVTATGYRGPSDDEAPTRTEAILEVMAPHIKSADAALARWKAKRAAEPPPEPEPEPMSPATARFFYDPD